MELNDFMALYVTGKPQTIMRSRWCIILGVARAAINSGVDPKEAVADYRDTVSRHTELAKVAQEFLDEYADVTAVTDDWLTS